MSTLAQKAAIAAPAALLFFLLNTPLAYNITNLLPGQTTIGNCPTAWGIVLHSIVFFLITFFTMGSRASTAVKADRSLMSTLIFFALSSQELYSLTGSRCPNIGQITLHSLLYFAALIGVMYF